MYPFNEEEKRIHPAPEDFPESFPASEQSGNEAPINEQHVSKVTYSEQPVSESVSDIPAYEPPTYSETAYNKPAYDNPVYKERNSSESVYSNLTYDAPVYDKTPYNEEASSEPGYNKPTYGEQVYSGARETPQWNLYSPGIGVNQPYPRSRSSEILRTEAQRKRASGFVSVLQAICLILVCSLFSAAATYAVIDYRIKRGDFTTTNQVVLGGSNTNVRQDEDLTKPVAVVGNDMHAQDIYDMARNQVVVINTEAPGFLGSPDSVAPVSGSGFIVSSDGYILTNYHVVELAFINDLPITVVLNNGKSHMAKVIGFEKENDVAIIKIDVTGLDPALIGNSDNIRVGQTAYAVGNPFGDLVFTMTDGIISALDRVVSVEGKSISTFQFSAAVNSGNSGGPVYNSAGEVIGIVTAKVVRGNVEGIGFAIPINDAIEIATEIIEHGFISGRPFIGITGQTVTSGHAEYYDWVVGVYIRGVSPDSAAETAGIAIGDIITGLGGEDVDSMEALKFALRDHRAGDTTSITVWRNRETIDLTITFDEDLYAGKPQIRPAAEPESPDPFEDYAP